jgi:uncharacterized protein
MITARHILESLADPTDAEKINTLYRFLFRLSSSHTIPFSRNNYYFLQRHVPNITYAGKGYRFITITHEKAVQLGIYDNEDDSIALKKPNLPKLITYFKNFRSGGLQSWARTIDGLDAEMGKQDFPDVRSEQGNFYIFQAHITGFLLESAAKEFQRLVKEFLKNPSPEITLSHEELEGMSDKHVRDFTSSEEIVAPMPSQVNFYGVFNGDEAVMHRGGLRELSKSREVIPDEVKWNYKLVTAVEDDSLDEAKHAIMNGANANITDRSGKYALYIAATHDNENKKMIRLLLEEGADIDAQDYTGQTALMGACEWGRDRSIEILLDYSPDVDLQDKKGWTALMYAVEQGYPPIVDMILSSRAWKGVRDNKDRTAEDICRQSTDMSNQEKKEILKLFSYY